MKSDIDPRLVRLLRLYSAAASSFSIATGAFALAGWAFNIAILKSWVPGGYSVRFNAAICFVLLGLAILIGREERPRPLLRRAAQIAAAIVTCVGLLTLLENLFGWNLHIDQLFHVVRPGEEVGGWRPGLIQLIPALSFGLLGGALLLLDWRTRRRDWPSQFLAGASMIAASLGILDFAFGQAGTQTNVAFPAALNFMLLSLAVVCTRPAWAVGGLLISATRGAQFLRHTAPAALAVVILCFALMSKALLTTVHLAWIEVSTIMITSSLLLVALIGWATILLDRSEKRRKQAEEALHLSPEELAQVMGRYEDSPVEQSIRRSAVIAIVLGVLLTIVGGLTNWSSMRRAARDADRVAHTHTVETALETTLSHVIDIETGARGFAATGGDSFLTPFLSGQIKIGADLEQLASLTADNPIQQQYLRELAPQLNAKVENAKATIAERNRNDDVPSFATFAEGQRRMDAVRNTLRAMRTEEARLLEQRTNASVQARAESLLATLISTLLGVLLLVAAGLITSREITRSANMRGQIQILNVSLEQRVKERTARLHLSEQRIRILLESTAEAILGENMDGNCTFCNAAAEHLLGYTNAELIGKDLRSLMHHPASVGTGTSPQECPLYQAVRTGRPFHADGITYWRKDGTAFLAECWSHPLIEGEKTIGSVLAFFDVTKRKQAEEEAREVRVRLESALASMTDAVFISDAQGRFINFNDAFAKFHRFKNKANCAKTFAEYPHFLEVFLGNSPEAAPLEMWAVPRALRGESVVDAEYTLQRKDTGESWMGSYSFAPIRGRSEEVVGAVVICRDITQTKANEREFRRLNEELEQRVQERTAELEAFAYSVSHDLRAPLRHINGFSKILMEECGASLTGDAQHSLQRIMEGATRMGHLIDDLLSLSRLGRQSLSPQITGLNALVQEVFAGLAPDAAGRRVEWKVGELGHANCDPALMRQVFQNLLSNALKYTRPRTEAIIEVGLQQQDGTPVLYVRDNGVGFSMKYVDKLFGVFQRLHRAEEFEGTGVGLATVRRIIQKHGGRIWAEAEPDKGATFSFTLGDSGAARPAAETKCVGDAA